MITTRLALALIGVFAVCGICAMAVADETPLTPSTSETHDVQLRDSGNGEWEIRTTGTDPYFYLKTSNPIDLAAQPIFEFEYSGEQSWGQMLLFVGSELTVPHLLTLSGPGRSEGWSTRSVDLTATREPATGAVKSLRMTVGNQPGLVVHLRAMHARTPSPAEAQAIALRNSRQRQDHDRSERLTAYLSRQFPAKVSAASLDVGRIHIEGNANDALHDFQLAEVPMWEDVTALKSPASLLAIAPDEKGKFTIDVPRIANDGRDRLLSAWAVVRAGSDHHYEPLSALHYIDEQKPRADLPSARPRSIKGIGGCPFSSPDIDLLGISSVTLNIVLNDLLDSKPGAGRTAYSYAGRTWYARDGVVSKLDRDMKTAADHGLMVSAIILIRPAGNSAKGEWIADAAHPDAEAPGVYVMPNFTSRAGVEAYAAAMNYLAERYSRPDGQFGRIHHWIMHNEISSGFYWTNAGDKSLITYLDLYQKSMRTAYLLARQYDPHAKPLISLDHCWTFCGDPRCYSDRDLLDRLVDFSRVEGDFEWGIAFHPYAHDLFNPRTWEDTVATFDFKTPFITFRNIEVLDAWVRQPRVAYHGQPREIQLSEQGLNSRDYSEHALIEQAAGLAYAWKKIEPLKTITAFQYHVWADNGHEGGLRLGLRKLGSDPQSPFGKKPSWDVFEAMGTDHWEKASAFAKPMIGIKDWGEVHYAGEIK